MTKVERRNLAISDCPRTCSACMGRHHWMPEDKFSCKHCPARIDYEEKCTRCGHELIDHSTDDTSCEAMGCDGCDAFLIAGKEL